MAEPSTIGRNLRRLRTDRGLSQEGLAEAAGVSVHVISKLEQGRRVTARLTTLTRIANGLDVDLGELVDRRDRMKNDRDGGSVLAVRDVLLSPAVLPGLDRDDDGEPTPVDHLEQSVAEGWRRYRAGQFGESLAMLPGIIGEARLTYSILGTVAIWPLAGAYELASSLMTQIGRTDLGIIASERAITTAYNGDDRLLWASVHATYSWTLFHQGRYREAEDLVVDMAQRVDPSFNSSEMELAVWGNLLLNAVCSTVAQERDPGEYLRLAAAGAARLARPVEAYHQVPFSPAAVAMQETYGYAALTQPDKALRATKRIGPDDLRGIVRGSHLMDIARAHLDSGHRRTAARTLLEAREVSPVWFRHQRVAKDVTAEIREQEQRLSPETRTLVKSLELDS